MFKGMDFRSTGTMYPGNFPIATCLNQCFQHTEKWSNTHATTDVNNRVRAINIKCKIACRWCNLYYIALIYMFMEVIAYYSIWLKVITTFSLYRNAIIIVIA